MPFDPFLIALAAVALLNIIYYAVLGKFSLSRKHSNTSDRSTPASIIVCAKNEQENLKELVPQLLGQQHDDFEIILVNDRSSDDSLEVMREWESASPAKVKVVDVVPNENFWGNKKYALTLGIKRAAHQRLFFIDADCSPASEQWLAMMNGSYQENTHIVLGYGAMYRRGGMLNALISFETLITALQYFGWARAGRPYMGVGRNLSYTTKRFYEVSGFMDHFKILGGDDDLFVNQAATAENTVICTDADAFTYSQPKTNWHQWWHQKRRHINTASYYKGTDQALLGIFWITQISFLITAVLALTLSQVFYIALSVVLFRYIIVYLIVGNAMSKLSGNNSKTSLKNLIPFIPVLEILLILSQLILGVANQVTKPKEW